MNINPGEMNKKIDICKPCEKDKYGFRSGEPILIMSKWAKYQRKNGKESDGAGTDTNESSVQFLIRYTKAEINTNMLIRYSGKIYDIEDVEDIQERHEYIRITCKRGEL